MILPSDKSGFWGWRAGWGEGMLNAGPVPSPAAGFGLEGVDLLEQVAVPINQRSLCRSEGHARAQHYSSLILHRQYHVAKRVGHPFHILDRPMDDNYRTPLIASAIEMAARNLALPGDVIFHSDRGSSYTSAEYAGVQGSRRPARAAGHPYHRDR
jgi:hypothetical protein